MYGNIFIDYLTELNEKIQINGHLNLLADHVHAENFYRDLLNQLFELSLSNTNRNDRNSVAIDLIDEQAKIIMQVSASCTKEKIEKTLSKKVMATYKKNGFQIKFLFIGKQNENAKGWKFANPYDIKFDPKTDIFLTKDLSREFVDKAIDTQNNIITLLKKELDPPIISEKFTFYLDDGFIDKHLSLGISSLGPRHSPELNVNTDNVLAFEALTISKYFQKENYKYLKEIIKNIKEGSERSLKSSEGKRLYREFMGNNSLVTPKITSFIENDSDFKQKIKQLEDIYLVLDKILYESDTYTLLESDLDKDDKNYLIKLYNAISNSITRFNYFLEKTCYKCLNNPYLLLRGEAGIGKSHLLADIAKVKREAGHIVFLFLGQHFTNYTDPWKQILNSLDLHVSTEEFLTIINKEAENSGKRAIIIIDALNEGAGRELWKNFFQKFIDQLKSYPNISFVFSIRTPFINQLLPKGFLEKNQIAQHEHYGFKEDGFSPIKSFCSYFDLEEPIFPLLNPEYHNPLFLKLVCELHTSEKRSSFDQSLKISNLFTYIIDDVNKKLSEYNRLDYDPDLDVIQEILQAVISIQHEAKYREMDYADVYKTVRKVAEEYTRYHTKVLEALIQENILMDTINYENKKVVYFAYERMGDYLLANYLLEPYKNNDFTKEELIKVIREDRNINKYFKTTSDLSFNTGLLEALFVNLAEKFSVELFELFSQFSEELSVKDAFIDSLIWRDGASITEVTKEYINNYIFRYQYTLDRFFDVLIQKSCLPDHPLNANTLYIILKNNQLPMRDAFWTTKISKNDTNIIKIIDWTRENSNKINSRAIELYGIVLTWVLSSTNLAIRDSSTKALVRLFKDSPFLMLTLLEKFRGIDDPYILERLYAAVYGGVVRSEKKTIYKEIGQFIYNEVFYERNVYPHILLRDYARQTLEFILLTCDISKIDRNKIKPPYKSEWYNYVPTNEEIDQLIQVRTKDKNPRLTNSAYRILSSMTTEYGRGVGGYGDFGRYIFGSAVRNWENQFNSDQELSNIAIKTVFEMGYDVDLHGEFDLNISLHDRHSNGIERIGKKYQWIAFHELMAKLADNFPTYEEKKIYTKEYEEQLERESQDFMKFLYGAEDEFGDTEWEQDEEKLDEKDHIIKIEKTKVAQYSEPWELSIRDFDPTFLLKEIKGKELELIPCQLPTNPTVEWVKNYSLFDESHKYLEMKFENVDYIALFSRFKWENIKDNLPYNERDSKLFYAGGFFVKNSDKEQLLKKRKEHISGNGVPVPNVHNIFAYEHFWSQSYMDYENERENYEYGRTIPACHEYVWEIDHSIAGEKSVSYTMPAKVLVDYFGLRQQDEGIWQNENQETICFNSMFLGYDKCLFFRKDKIKNFLKEKNYSLMWGVYAEKVAKKHFHEWWYTVDYDDGKFNKVISDEKCMEYKR